VLESARLKAALILLDAQMRRCFGLLALALAELKCCATAEARIEPEIDGCGGRHPQLVSQNGDLLIRCDGSLVLAGRDSETWCRRFGIARRRLDATTEPGDWGLRIADAALQREESVERESAFCGA
jgi:hypothetical protein